MPKYPIQFPVDEKRAARFARLQALFPNRIIGCPAPNIIETTNAFSTAELQQVQDTVRDMDRLDSWESSKLRNLTIDQINNEVASLDAGIDAAQNLAQAKVVLKKLLADDAKAWRIILWLLKREQNEL